MKQFVKNFNNLIKKTIFKVQNKTNNKFKISNFNKQLITFNNLIKKTIFKVQNKTNNKFKISNFNKQLITFISLLFIYLFYLLIPILYDKTWVQTNIEKQLQKEFKANFSTSSNISYRILPTPHFLIKDSKIFHRGSENTTSFSEIKILKVFISQKNFFNKKNIIVKKINIDNANFSLFRNDFKLLNNASNNKLSNKKIEINNSKIFFKDNLNETTTIIKISKALLFFDEKNLLNLFNLKGETFNIPFILNFNSDLNFVKKKEINIKANKLKLNIFNQYVKEKDNIISGKNIISFINSTISTVYSIEKNLIVFKSDNSKVDSSKTQYDGVLSINPFNLSLNIDLGNYKISKLFNINSTFNELINTELLFNNNVSVNTSIVANNKSRREIFQKAKVNFNIINGKINLDKTKLINNKIGSLELENSNLFVKNKRLILNTNIIINIDNSDELFFILQTNKKSRKPIKNILINIDYDFLGNLIKFNHLQIDNNKTSEEILRVIQGFSENEFNNLNKSKRLLNSLFEIYNG